MPDLTATLLDQLSDCFIVTCRARQNSIAHSIALARVRGGETCKWPADVNEVPGVSLGVDRSPRNSLRQKYAQGKHGFEHDRCHNMNALMGSQVHILYSSIA